MAKCNQLTHLPFKGLSQLNTCYLIDIGQQTMLLVMRTSWGLREICVQFIKPFTGTDWATSDGIVVLIRCGDCQ